MISADVKTSLDLGKFKNFRMDLSPEINRAADVVVRDIQRHIASQARIDTGGRQAPLSPRTVKAKREKGGLPAQHQTDILIEYENLWHNQNVKKATTTRPYAEITIGPTRAQIGAWLQEGTDIMPARPFFGISAPAEADVMRMMELTIERELKKL